MSDYTVAPPAAAEWDVDDIAERALAVLRLRDDDVDATRVAAQAAAACQRVDELVDRPDTAAPTTTMVEGAIALTVEMYATGGTGSLATTADGTIVIAGIRLLVRPARQRWGIA